MYEFQNIWNKFPYLVILCGFMFLWIIVNILEAARRAFK